MKSYPRQPVVDVITHMSAAIFQYKLAASMVLHFNLFQTCTSRTTDHHHHHTTTVLRPFSWDQPLELVPEENFWTLWCKGRLTEADTLTIRLGATPSGLSGAHLHHLPCFYRPDALPAAQPTVSNHSRQLAHSD